MAEKAREAMGTEDLTAVADRGYYKSEEILACHEAGIVPIVPKSLTSTAEANGRFGKEAFRYVPRLDEYRCPANQRLTRRTTMSERGLTLYRYWTSNCGSCPLKARCTPGTERRVTRWEHEEVLVTMQRRLDRDPKKMRIRRQTAEHPFGTLKAWMGATHFLTRTLGRVSTEMSLHVLAYNLKRMMKIMGTGPLIAAMRRRARNAVRISAKRRKTARSLAWSAIPCSSARSLCSRCRSVGMRSRNCSSDKRSSWYALSSRSMPLPTCVNSLRRPCSRFFVGSDARAAARRRSGSCWISVGSSSNRITSVQTIWSSRSCRTMRLSQTESPSLRQRSEPMHL